MHGRQRHSSAGSHCARHQWHSSGGSTPYCAELGINKPWLSRNGAHLTDSIVQWLYSYKVRVYPVSTYACSIQRHPGPHTQNSSIPRWSTSSLPYWSERKLPRTKLELRNTPERLRGFLAKHVWSLWPARDPTTLYTQCTSQRCVNNRNLLAIIIINDGNSK